MQEFTPLYADAYEANARALELHGLPGAAAKWRRALKAQCVISPFDKTVRRVVAKEPDAPIAERNAARQAQILAVLRNGPRTADQIAEATGLGVATVKALLKTMRGDCVSGKSHGTTFLWFGQVGMPYAPVTIKEASSFVCDMVAAQITTPVHIGQIKAETGLGRSTINRALNTLMARGVARVVSVDPSGRRTWVSA